MRFLSAVVAMSSSHNLESPRARTTRREPVKPLRATCGRPRQAVSLPVLWCQSFHWRPSGLKAGGRARQLCYRGVLPTSGRRDALVDLTRPPAARLVFVDRGSRLQNRVDDSPCLFNVVLTRKQRGISLHGISQHTLVRIHL